MQAGDKRAAAAVLRRQALRVRGEAEGIGRSGWGSEEAKRLEEEAWELEAVAGGLDEEARAEEEEAEARALWAARCEVEGF